MTVYPVVCFFACPSRYLPVGLSVCRSVGLAAGLAACLPACLPGLSVCLPISRSVCLCACLLICLLLRLSVCRSVGLSVNTRLSSCFLVVVLLVLVEFEKIIRTKCNHRNEPLAVHISEITFQK